MQIVGVIERGRGHGAFFVGLGWVVEQFEREMGFKPFPGTLNVRVSPEDVSQLERLFSDEDFELVPDDPQFCSARVKRLTVNGVPAAAVLPSEDVRIHGKDVIEIMAGCHIKQALQLDDGDPVTLILNSGILWHGRSVKGVVFDLDGTLTNSIQLYHEAFREIAARLGIRMKRDELFAMLAEGMNPWKRAFPEDLPNREERLREFKRLAGPSFAAALKHVRPFPGVDRVLAELYARGLKIGLVTDSSTKSLEPLQSPDIIHYFSAVVTKDDGVPKKPDPDGLIECLQRMEIPAENAVFVGDSLIDIRAGKEAGTLTIGVLTGLANRRQFEAESPTALVDDVTQIAAVLV